ncbi:cysteine hydrolase family protein [Paenarthrobacter nicotinovorans]|uniref:cysteine hydrolase family protein n=1 Tax=Paenarthrobacter nicotinovorans TaxID=29320 RepID=UPI003829B15A
MPKTHPLTLDPSRTAIVAIDIQNSYVHTKGTIARGGADISMMAAVIPPIRDLVTAGRERGYSDIWTRHVHYPNDVTRTRHKILPHSLRWDAGPTVLKGTWDSEFADGVADLTQDPAEIVLKHRFSSFLDTRLDTLLRMNDVDTLILTGVTTTHCVETTARDAYMRDYDVIVVSDAVGALTQEAHDASLWMLDTNFGKVLSSAEVLRLIDGETLDIDYLQGWVKN